MGQNLVGEFITKEYKDAVSTVLDKALQGEETAWVHTDNFMQIIVLLYFHLTKYINIKATLSSL